MSMNTPTFKSDIEFMDYWLGVRMNNVHTQIPAKVKAVDYDKGMVTVQPLIKTFMRKGITVNYPAIAEVPIKYPSAKRGKARMTMPTAVNDIGVLYFSEKDNEIYRASSGEAIVEPVSEKALGLGGKLFPMCWEGEFFTGSKGMSVDGENIVIENEDSIVIMGTDYMKLHNGSAIVELQKNGEINANGATITPDGNVITAGGADLQALWDKNWIHNHGGVVRGGSDTDNNKPS